MPDGIKVVVDYKVDSDTVLHDANSFDAGWDLTMSILGIEYGGHLDWSVQQDQISIRMQDSVFMGPFTMTLPTGYSLSARHVQDALRLLQIEVDEQIGTNFLAFPEDDTRNR